MGAYQQDRESFEAFIGKNVVTIFVILTVLMIILIAVALAVAATAAGLYAGPGMADSHPDDDQLLNVCTCCDYIKAADTSSLVSAALLALFILLKQI